MSEETCPVCGKEGLLYCMGVIECPNGDYSRILSPCVHCSIPIEHCPSEEKCKRHQNWKAKQPNEWKSEEKREK
jgi:hypothetical protein